MKRPTPLHRTVAAATLANLGDGIRVVAFPLLAASTTRDPVAVSALTACVFLPWVLFGLPIGALVDRRRPEVVMVAANAARCVLLTVLAVLLSGGLAPIAVLYVLAFLLGIGEALYDNAAQSLVPRIVADADLEKANGALITGERLGQDLVGPAAGGVLFAASAVLPFGLNVAALLVAMLLLVGLRTAQPTTAPAAALRGLGRETADGMRWLLAAPHVRVIVLTGTALTFFTMTWESTLVLLATGPMGVSDAGYGAMLAAGAVGGVLGAALTPALTRRLPQRGLQIGSIAATALIDLALALFPTPAMAAIAWGGTGFAFTLWNVLSVSLRQRLVPPALLGRVNGANRTFSMTAVPAGALAGGFLADAFGLHAPPWVSGIALTVLAVAYALTTRSVPRTPAAGPDDLRNHDDLVA